MSHQIIKASEATEIRNELAQWQRAAMADIDGEAMSGGATDPKGKLFANSGRADHGC